ncbi:MAG: hypothetical protein WC807_08350 [Hyphomicrobium sp.]|jgi:hypothetical protein
MNLEPSGPKQSNPQNIGATWPRSLALLIGGAEIAAFILFATLMLQSSDPLGSAIGFGMTALMALPVGLLTLPGVLLAWRTRYSGAALALVLAAALVAVGLWLTA